MSLLVTYNIYVSTKSFFTKRNRRILTWLRNPPPHQWNHSKDQRTSLWIKPLATSPNATAMAQSCAWAKPTNGCGSHSHRRSLPGYCPGRRRHPAWPDHRNLRPGVIRKNHDLPAYRRRSQNLGGTCAYIDMEHALDPSYAARCGVDVEDLADFPAGYRRTGPRNR